MFRYPKFSRALFLFLFVAGNTAGAQDYIQPVADYSFENNEVVDNSGNTLLFLRNNAGLVDDPVRGKVLHFSSTQKGYAVLNKQLLNSDSCTISFFFLWESAGATNWHQVFEIHHLQTGSNLYFTPQNGWGSYQCSLISDSKEYGTYQNVDAHALAKNAWMHIAVTFSDKTAKIYINGQLASSGSIMFTPDLIKGDSLYFGGNPYRSDNYYISARLDDIKIFDVPLTGNQVLALSKGTEIPAPAGSQTDWETTGTPLELTVDLDAKRQTIRNFGSSDAWNTEKIGKCWPEEKKKELSRLLFSSEKDGRGNPMGIGLSAWRFNIGAGTAEQGNDSRISVESRRTEGFLNADSVTYDWNKQAGQQWFLKEAAIQYQVPDIIGWTNSPPVLYTQKNLGFRDFGTPVSTILKAENVGLYARFLADVAEHFEGEGVHFRYISPLNEPQWDWSPSTSGGTVTQEGSPWTNQEIFDVGTAIHSEFSARSINTTFFISEAGSISSLLRGTGHADNQLNQFWNVNSSLSLVGTQAFSDLVSYHSYWSDYGDLLVDERTALYDHARLLNPVPELWQTEYSLLGSGYREGYPDPQKLAEMDCALSLARIMAADLNIANTGAWQWWTTFETGKHDGESRFGLIEAYTNLGNNDGEFHLTKLFYAFGCFSHFIRPGMKRVETARSDQLTLKETYQDVVFSAYENEAENKLVIVGINFTHEARAVNLKLTGESHKTVSNPSLFLTDEFSNLAKQDVDLSSGSFIVPARSVVTYTADLEDRETGISELKGTGLDVFYNDKGDEIVATFSPEAAFQEIKLFGISGNLIQTTNVAQDQKRVIFPASGLPAGVYIVSANGIASAQSGKIIVTKK
jgi:O-glycosyl hydrolase